MKVKKVDSKNKKKKNKILPVASSAIKKTKKVKKVKVDTNTEVGEAIKNDLIENQSVTPKKIPLRQERWNSYLQVFLQHEKLNKKQKQIMEFCTTKGTTPPRRRTKFLNFIRNCYNNQTDVTDEQIYELFDVLLQKYTEFKSGNYHNVDPTSSGPTKTSKLSKNKKKKLKLAAAVKTNSSPAVKTNSSPVKVKNEGENWTKVKTKKKKRSKDSAKMKNNVKMETDD